MTWLYHGDEVTDEQVDGYFGFVYLITNLDTNRMYVGKKFFTKAKTLKPLKGKVRKRRSRVDSGWRDYWGSSNALLAEIEQYSTLRYRREILRLCKSRAECTYYEAKFQFERDVLLYPNAYYNEQIMCRIHATHMNPKKKARN